jgi:hypothetical protein
VASGIVAFNQKAWLKLRVMCDWFSTTLSPSLSCFAMTGPQLGHFGLIGWRKGCMLRSAAEWHRGKNQKATALGSPFLHTLRKGKSSCTLGAGAEKGDREKGGNEAGSSCYPRHFSTPSLLTGKTLSQRILIRGLDWPRTIVSLKRHVAIRVLKHGPMHYNGSSASETR